MSTRQLRDLKAGKGIKFIEGDDKIRTDKCLAEINEILEQYDCIMMPEFLISGINMQSRVKIMVKPKKSIIQ